MQVLFIILAIVVVAGVGYYAWLQEKKRREAMAALAVTRFQLSPIASAGAIGSRPTPRRAASRST